MADDYRGQPNLPRGIRNNNPGNIKADGTNWQGMVGSDGTFIIFADMSWGIRALGTALANMINKGYDTIGTLIPQWSATDQAAYVRNVSAYTGLDPSTQLGTDADTIQGLIIAIVNQENGAAASYVTPQDIAEGMSKINNSLVTAIQSAVVQVTSGDPSNVMFYIALAIGGVFLISYLVNRKK